MPSTISRRTTKATGSALTNRKGSGIKTAVRWKNLANGKSVEVDSDFKISSTAVKALKSVGILVSPKSHPKIDEGQDIKAFLKSVGAKKLTPARARFFQKHLSA